MLNPRDIWEENKHRNKRRHRLQHMLELCKKSIPKVPKWSDTDAPSLTVGWRGYDPIHIIKLKMRLLLHCRASAAASWPRAWEPRPQPLPSLTGDSLHIASVGKRQHSKFRVQFLLNACCFHTTVQLRDCNLSHRESGAVRTGIELRTTTVPGASTAWPASFSGEGTAWIQPEFLIKSLAL